MGSVGAGKPGGPTRRPAPGKPSPGGRAPAPGNPSSGPWPCYWLERTGTAAVALRRYEQTGDGSTCAGGWHEALAWTDDTVEWPLDAEWTHPLAESVYPAPAARSRRWPRECGDCGHRFTADARRQVWCEELFDGPGDDPWTTHWRMTPPGCQRAGWGAMWDAPWTQRFRPNPDKPDDGVWLVVRCPFRFGNDWQVDNASSSGGFWTRTGDPRDPPTLTVSPSIAIGQADRPGYYHGFLQSGRLTAHVG